MITSLLNIALRPEPLHLSYFWTFPFNFVLLFSVSKKIMTMMFQSIVKYFCERKFDFVIEGNIYPSLQS